MDKYATFSREISQEINDDGDTVIIREYITTCDISGRKINQKVKIVITSNGDVLVGG